MRPPWMRPTWRRLAAVAIAMAASVAASPPKVPPVTVVISSPAAASPLFSHLRLQGRIATASGSLLDLQSVRWTMAGTDRTGALDWDADGAFQADLSADGISSDLTVTVTARLKNGSTGTASVTLRDRGRGPGVFIQSPRRGTVYGSSLRVSGQVRGPAEAPAPLSEVASLSWSVESSALGGPLPFGRDGVFDFSFSTIGLHGNVVLDLAAVDRNGHKTVAALPLSDRPGGPALKIDSPADKSEYGNEVSVSGRVGDPSDPSGTPGEVKTLTWRIVEQPSISGTVSRAKDGTFAFRFSSAELTGPRTLEMTAEDRNGRTTVAAVSLAGALASRPAAAVIAKQPQKTPQQAPQKPPVQPSVQPLVSGEGPRISVSSPAEGGFYQDITVIAGQVTPADGAQLKALTWEAAGTGKSGKVNPDDEGAFKLPLDLSDVTGDLSLKLRSEDTKGRSLLATLTLHDGRLKPAIALTSPAKGSSYGTMIRVSGTVTDPYAGRAGMEGMQGIESASYLLSPVSLGRSSAPVRGTVTLGEGGAFRFSLPALALKGDQDLTLTAISRNGNRAQVTVRLSQGDGDLPGFRLVPADRTVVASWDPVPFVRRYDLTVTPEGAGAASAAPQSLSGVSAPVKVTGLENGVRYALQVTAHFDDGTSGSSAVVHFIPLSPQTLAPLVTGEYQEIRLSWKGVPGAQAYDVWRSSGHAGNGNGSGGAGAGGNGAAAAGTASGSDPAYSKVASALTATAWKDAGVEFGRSYSYTISPASVLAPMSAPGSARSLAFPEEKLALLAHLPLKAARGITVSGGYAFIASGAEGSQVIDVSNPAAPAKVGQIDATDAWDVEVRGDFAYVADGESGLRVLDVSTPRQPLELGQRKTNDARAVALWSKYAYVADGDKGLKVIDVSDPRELPRVAQVETQNALGLAAADGFLYVADGAGGLKVYDLKRPAAPSLAATLALSDARQVAVQGTLAAVADGKAGLRMVDLADPVHPVLLSTLSTGSAGAAAVSLEAGFAYVADDANGVTVVNVENPSRPSAFVTQTAAGASAVSVRGRLALITGRDGLDIVRVQIIGRSFAVASCAAVGKSFDVTVDGDWAYAASHADGLRLVNVRDPGDLADGSYAGSFPTRFAQSVTVKDHLAYVADGSSGVRIVDVSPAWTPGGKAVEVGAYRPGGSVSRAVPYGSLLYVAAGDRGMHILDLGTPAAPALLSSVRTRDATDVAVTGTWAFVADGDGGVRVVDVSTPASPVLLAASIKGDAQRLALAGKVLVATGSTGVSFIDISDPSAPRLLSRWASSSAQSTAVRGSYVYVAEGYKGLTVLDISRPDRPAVVTTCEDVFAQGVSLKDDFAIVADPHGLKVVQILVPSWLQGK